MSFNLSPMSVIEQLMQKAGARRIVFKCLSNNDNSKNQIYLGGNFDVLRLIKHGDLVASDRISAKKGVMYKASLELHWITPDGRSQKAPGSQLILYPKYPEVRMSGFVQGCSLAPSHLLREPTPEERAIRLNTPRCLMLGLCDDNRILAFVDHWTGPISHEAKCLVESGKAVNVGTVLYERITQEQNNRDLLLQRLGDIHRMGFIRSCRLNSAGERIEYNARNGAGYTLESLFDITPNGRPEPDHLGWELKSHSSGPVTLMTPEPDTGIYLDDLGLFLETYGNRKELRRDFTGRHIVGKTNNKTGLTLRMEGFDPEKQLITDPAGGLILRDNMGNIAAGWTFNKLLTHWSNKHAHTAYIPYVHEERDSIRYYSYGPMAHLCEGAELPLFFSALGNGSVYYDPGINMKLQNGKWKPKKRNQFRIAWKDVGKLYERIIEESLE